jgi:hypothetical protein
MDHQELKKYAANREHQLLGDNLNHFGRVANSTNWRFGEVFTNGKEVRASYRGTLLEPYIKEYLKHSVPIGSNSKYIAIPKRRALVEAKKQEIADKIVDYIVRQKGCKLSCVSDIGPMVAQELRNLFTDKMYPVKVKYMEYLDDLMWGIFRELARDMEIAQMKIVTGASKNPVAEYQKIKEKYKGISVIPFDIFKEVQGD